MLEINVEKLMHMDPWSHNKGSDLRELTANYNNALNQPPLRELIANQSKVMIKY
jgi:hypothetical protein